MFGPWAQRHWPLGAPSKVPYPWEGPGDLVSSVSRPGAQHLWLFSSRRADPPSGCGWLEGKDISGESRGSRAQSQASLVTSQATEHLQAGAEAKGNGLEMAVSAPSLI